MFNSMLDISVQNEQKTAPQWIETTQVSELSNVRSLQDWRNSFVGFVTDPEFDDQVAKDVIYHFLESKYDAHSLKEAVLLRGSEANSEKIIKNLRKDFLIWLKNEQPKYVSKTVNEDEKEEKVEEETRTPIILDLNQEKLDKFVEPDKQKFVQNFIGAWSSGEVKNVVFTTKNGEVNTVQLELNNGKRSFLFVSVFRHVFDGVGRQKEGMNVPTTGLRFYNIDGDNVGSINPHTKPDLAKLVLADIHLGGKKLNSDFQVIIKPDDYVARQK